MQRGVTWTCAGPGATGGMLYYFEAIKQRDKQIWYWMESMMLQRDGDLTERHQSLFCIVSHSFDITIRP